MEQAEQKQYTKEQFKELFNELCIETGFTIVSRPEFRYRDDDTFSVIVVQYVEKMPTEKK